MLPKLLPTLKAFEAFQDLSIYVTRYSLSCVDVFQASSTHLSFITCEVIQANEASF